MGQVTSLKPSVTQKLDGISIIIHLTIQNPQNTSKTISTSFAWAASNSPKKLRPGKTLRHHILLT